MDAIYKLLSANLALAVCGWAQSNLTAPVTVTPPAATDPACIRLREQLSNGTNFMAFCPQNNIAASYAFQIPKWDFAGAGTDSTNSYVITRAFYLGDKTGTNTGALWKVSAEAQPSVGPQNFSIEDPGGAPVVTFTRYFLGVQNEAKFSGHILPTTTNTQDAGSSTLDFRNVYTRNILSSGAAFVNVNDDLQVTGNILPEANATRNLGSSILNFNNANIRTIVSDQTTVVIGQSLTVNGAFIIPQTDNTTDFGLASPARYFKDILFKGEIYQGATKRLDSSGNLTVTSCTGCGSSSQPFSDATPLVKNSGDATKQLTFLLSGLPTATSRTLQPQDANYTIAGINIAQTFTTTQSFSDIQPQTTATYTNGNSSKVWLSTHVNTINGYDHRLCDSSLGNCRDIAQSATNVVHFTNASGTDWMVFGDAGTPNVTVGPALFIPLTTNNTDLGSSSRTFKSMFLSGSITVSGLSGQSTSITVQHFPTGACTLGFTSGILTTATGSC